MSNQNATKLESLIIATITSHYEYYAYETPKYNITLYKRKPSKYTSQQITSIHKYIKKHAPNHQIIIDYIPSISTIYHAARTQDTHTQLT